MDEYFQKYLKLRNELDAEISKLEIMHTSKMQCRKGCDSCCESIRIFPIEYHFIQNQINKADLPALKLKHRFSKSCRFLVNGSCQIYKFRPFICRTQGLPLLYENQQGNGYELSVCKLNFKDVRVEVFNAENALFMPPFNSRLFLLNKEYVEMLSNKKLNNTKRIQLNRL